MIQETICPICGANRYENENGIYRCQCCQHGFLWKEGKMKMDEQAALLERDVFLVYSVKQMIEARELCEKMEKAGLTCYLIERNMPRGFDTELSYREVLTKAIEQCRTVVYLSSHDSRKISCDAFRELIPIINDHFPNKPRLEYLVDCYDETDSQGVVACLKDFFSGVKAVTNADELIEMVVGLLTDK